MQYTRALKATKLERMFAKPFVGALDGHTDAVYRMATSRQSLVAFLTGACDGEIKLWDLPRQRCVKSLHAHAGYVRGLAVSHDGRHFFSCGDDKSIKQHRMSLAIRGSGSRAGQSQKGGGGGDAASGDSESEDSEDEDDVDAAVATWHGKEPFMCAAPRLAARVVGWPHHPCLPGTSTTTGASHSSPRRAPPSTCGTTLGASFAEAAPGLGAAHPPLPFSSDPVHTYSWGADTIQCVRFNPAEPCLMGSTASDRNICLYDTRGSTPVRKLVMGMRSNSLAWNPMEPFNFTVVRAAPASPAVRRRSPRADRCLRPTRTTTPTRSTCAVCNRLLWSTATTYPLCACLPGGLCCSLALTRPAAEWTLPTPPPGGSLSPDPTIAPSAFTTCGRAGVGKFTTRAACSGAWPPLTRACTRACPCAPSSPSLGHSQCVLGQVLPGREVRRVRLGRHQRPRVEGAGVGEARQGASQAAGCPAAPMPTRLRFDPQLLPRERAAMNYNEKLKKRFEQVEDVKRIARCARGRGRLGKPQPQCATGVVGV